MSQDRPQGITRRDVLIALTGIMGGTIGGALSGGGGIGAFGLAGKTSQPATESPRARKRIAIGILGQSNEQNRVPPADIETSPNAFASIYNPAVTAPQLGNLVMRHGGSSPNGRTKTMLPFGGMWFAVYDRLWELGYDATIANGAIGNASMVRDFAGTTSPWRAGNSGYFEARQPFGPGDYGHAGSVIVSGEPGRIFRCIKGRQQFATLEGRVRLPGTQIDTLDYIVGIGEQRSGLREPDWNSVAEVGDTISDGDLIWSYEGINNLGLASPESGRGGFNQALGAGFWDPLGIIDRLTRMMQAISSVEERWIIIQNGQSDYAGSPESSEAYRRALENITQYFIDRGFFVAIGLSCFALIQEETSWDGLDAARSNALSSFEGHPRVRQGANLYRGLGTQIGHLLQDDQVHLNGEGALAAGDLWGDQFARILVPRA